jgi:hypothetical protein
MFGITFDGNPDMRNIYLPTGFEGHPLRKDFPLLARVVKPWPGIVDVEPMPGEATTATATATATPFPGQEATLLRWRSVARMTDDRGPAAGLHRRPGRGCPHQRRARDRRRHGAQHGAAAPRHPRHAAPHRPPRRRAGGQRGRGLRLHAPRLREAGRGPDLPPGHHPGEPHRLARQLRQRGPVHPRRRAAHGDRGPAPGPVDPHDPLRAVPPGQHHPVHRRPGPAAGRPDRGVLRLPGPGVRPQPDRGRHRRALPPELRPHRRPEGRPAQGLGGGDQGGHGPGPPVLPADGGPGLRQRDLPGPHPRHRGHPGPGRPVLRAHRRQPAGLGRRLGPAPRRLRRPGPRPAGLEGLDPPRRRLLRPVLGAPPGGAGVDPDDRPAPRRPARRADHGQGAPHHQGPRGRGLRRHREPAGPDVVLRGLQGRHRPVPGQDPLRQLQQHLRAAVGAQGRLRARRDLHPGQPLLHPRRHRSR